MKTETQLVHISDIKPGDTIRHNGQLKTVCKNNITHSQWHGVCIFGDSYHGGRKPVERVLILRALPGNKWARS